LNPDLKAQKSSSFEVGIKGEVAEYKTKYLKNTLFEVAFYNTKIEDVIVPFVVDGDVYYRNAAVSKRTGVEVGFSSELVKGLTLKGSYAYQNFKYDEYLAGNIDSLGNETNEDYSGNVEASNPENFAAGEIMYQYTFAKKYTLYAKSSIQYVGGMFVDDANTDSLKTEAYTLINGQLGIDCNINNFRLIAYGGLNNIADQKYVAFININSANRDYYESGPRMNFFGGLTLAYMFK
jgi:iron complex outermembrane recepter protein